MTRRLFLGRVFLSSLKSFPVEYFPSLSSKDRWPDDRRSPVRAEHEIYVGNYPVKFREADVRRLFEESGIAVGAIRMKMDGLKV